MNTKMSKSLHRAWRPILLTAALAICAAIALPFTLPDEDDQKPGQDTQPKKLALMQQDQLQPEVAVRATYGDPMPMLNTVALYMAIDNSVASGNHIDTMLEHWNEVDLCRLAWPNGADVFTGNDTVYACVKEVMQTTKIQNYGDQFTKDKALQGPYGALHEVTITALDPASWYPQLARVTAPCRAGYRAYVRSVHTTFIDRMSVWEFVKDQFNYCVLQVRSDAVEPDQTENTENNLQPATTQP